MRLNFAGSDDLSGSKSGSLAALIAAFALLGAVVSIYTVVHHLALQSGGVTNFFCNINDAFSCDDVARSEYSAFKGVPLGVFGLSFFLAVLLLTWNAFYKLEQKGNALLAMLFLTGGSVVASAGLFYVSAFMIGKYCVSCIAVYVICLIIFGLSYFLWKNENSHATAKGLSNALLSAAVVFAVFGMGYGYVFPPKSGSGQNAANKMNAEELQARLRELTASGANPIPVSRSAYVGAGEDYRKGPDDAKVVIIEFADFQCPACAVASKMLDGIHKEFPTQVQVVFRNFPLNGACNPSMGAGGGHPLACDIAAAARCAGDRGKFWEFHNLAFAEQSPQTNAATVSNWALKVGLTQADLEACLKSQDIIAKLRSDSEDGQKLGVNHTPYILVNGIPFEGNVNTPDEIRLFITQIIGN